MPNKQDLIIDWELILGDLPEEWQKYIPHGKGTQF